MTEATDDHQLVIVSGLSGSGKSVALRALEDLGFFCIDNLPVSLLQSFAQKLGMEVLEPYRQVAIGIDIRVRQENISRLPALVTELRDNNSNTQLFYIEADDPTLIKRFSETRRRHPLSSQGLPLPQAIRQEKEMLSALRDVADWIIDTSTTNVHELRRAVTRRLATTDSTLTLLLESFAFKRGVPADVDFAFDVRCLPNPHWEKSLRALTGKDEGVRKFLGGHQSVHAMVRDIRQFLEHWLPAFEDSDRSNVTVGIGCTGGRHRSVYVVEALARHFREIRESVMVHHREIEG